MHRRTNSGGSPSTARFKTKAYDQDSDDRIHNVHRRDESDFIAFLSHARQRITHSRRLLFVLGILLVSLIVWSWWRPSHSAPDWSKFAYVQYADEENQLCNALMVFESLKQSGSKAQRVLLYHPEWSSREDGGKDKIADLLSIAHRKYGVELRPVKAIDSHGGISQPDAPQEDFFQRDTSATRLRALDLTDYHRLIVLDSDITLFKHVDELFLLPKTPIAMPRAYWHNTTAHQPIPLSSSLIVLEPNPTELKALLLTLQSWTHHPPRLNHTTSSTSTSTDLLNHRFHSSALILPHRPYILSSSEFRTPNHARYLGTTHGPSTAAPWNALQIFHEAHLILFNDDPLPKPYFAWPDAGRTELQPDCKLLDARPTGRDGQSCRERDIWLDLYDEFCARRERVCRLAPVPAPEWTWWKEKMASRGR